MKRLLTVGLSQRFLGPENSPKTKLKVYFTGNSLFCKNDGFLAGPGPKF